MHEMGIVLHMVKTLNETAKENDLKRIARVTLEVGEVHPVSLVLLCDADDEAEVRLHQAAEGLLVAGADAEGQLALLLGGDHGTAVDVRHVAGDGPAAGRHGRGDLDLLHIGVSCGSRVAASLVTGYRGRGRPGRRPTYEYTPVSRKPFTRGGGSMRLFPRIPDGPARDGTGRGVPSPRPAVIVSPPSLPGWGSVRNGRSSRGSTPR